jgi:protein-disulfide isomerase
MNNKLLIGLALVISLSLGVYFVTTPKTAEQLGPVFGAASAQVVGEIDTSEIMDMVLGEEDSPIKVIEYASFTCPHCRSFHQDSFKNLKIDYIDTNKVHFTYREIYFDRYGLWASIIARCGGQDKFFAISDLLYTKQREWTQGSPAEIAANLRRIGITAGLSQDDVQACFTDGQKAQNLVAWYEENSKNDEVTSTPSFLINGKKYSNMSYTELKQILDAQ